MRRLSRQMSLLCSFVKYRSSLTREGYRSIDLPEKQLIENSQPGHLYFTFHNIRTDRLDAHSLHASCSVY